MDYKKINEMLKKRKASSVTLTAQVPQESEKTISEKHAILTSPPNITSYLVEDLILDVTTSKKLKLEATESSDKTVSAKAISAIKVHASLHKQYGQKASMCISPVANTLLAFSLLP